jgi:hypothetical protein
VSRRLVFIALAGCAPTPPSAAPVATSSVSAVASVDAAAKESAESCRHACEHAVDMQLDVVETGKMPRAAALRSARERYVSECTSHCSDFDVDAVLGATSVTDLAGALTMNGKPLYPLAVLDDVYPLDQFLTGAPEHTRISLAGYAKSFVADLPRELHRAAGEPCAFEVGSGWMTPLKFRFQSESKLGTLAALRARFRFDRELAATEADGHPQITAISNNGREISTLVFLPTGSDESGILCEGFATRGSGFADVSRVARFLQGVCKSLRLE